MIRWVKKKYIDKISLEEPPAHVHRTSAGRPPEAGRQKFERNPAAIRGRKKPFANRIRELWFGCRCGVSADVSVAVGMSVSVGVIVSVGGRVGVNVDVGVSLGVGVGI